MATHADLHGFETSLKLDLRVLRWRDHSDQDDAAMLAFELANAGRVHDAIEIIDEALVRDAGDVDVLLSCGIAAKRAGQFAFAQWSLLRAAKRAPNWSAPWIALMEVLEARQKPEDALRAARRALALGDRDARALRMVAEDDKARALETRLQSFLANPSCDEPALLAHALIEAKRHDDALLVVTKANDDDADLWLIESDIRRELGQFDQAQRALQRAAAVASDWNEPSLRICRAAMEDGSLLDAIAIAEQRLKAYPKDVAFQVLRSEIEAKMRELGVIRPDRADSAVDAFMRTLDRIDPIGEVTRGRLASGRDKSISFAMPLIVQKPESSQAMRRQNLGSRSGFLPRLASRLFGPISAPEDGDSAMNAPRPS